MQKLIIISYLAKLFDTFLQTNIQISRYYNKMTFNIVESRYIYYSLKKKLIKQFLNLECPIKF